MKSEESKRPQDASKARGSRSSRVRSGILAVCWFAVGFCVWAFTTGWIRGSIGDLAVVAFIAHVVGVIWPGHIGIRAAGALVFAFCVEGVQLLDLVGPDSPEWQHILLGSTFDPMDLVHYTISAFLAVAAELGLNRWATRTTRPE